MRPAPTQQQCPELNSLRPQRLEGNDIHVWHIDLRISEERLRESRHLLSLAEQDRAARYVFERDKRRFIATHAAVRRILGTYTRQTPRDLEFEASAFGKPRLRAFRNLHFNVSHSEELAICAVARSEVGIDVEFLRPRGQLNADRRGLF